MLCETLTTHPRTHSSFFSSSSILGHDYCERERERERESGAGAFFSPLLRAAALPATRDSLLFFVHALCVCFLIAFHFLFFPRGLKEFERERERER